MPECGGDIRDRPQHESMLQLLAGNLQMPRPVEYQRVVEHDVDIQSAIGIARQVAAAAMTILQRVQSIWR